MLAWDDGRYQCPFLSHNRDKFKDIYNHTLRNHNVRCCKKIKAHKEKLEPNIWNGTET